MERWFVIRNNIAVSRLSMPCSEMFSPCTPAWHELKEESSMTPTWSRIVFLFLVSVTADSCMSPIFFIFSSMSIFCSSFLISARSSRTVSSLWCWRATVVAHAEWMAVIQFSSSVWLQVYRGRDHERSKVTQHTNSFVFVLFCSWCIKKARILKIIKRKYSQYRAMYAN